MNECLDLDLEFAQSTVASQFYPNSRMVADSKLLPDIQSLGYSDTSNQH